MTNQRRHADDDEQQDISLARLTEAFAEVLGKADPSLAEVLGKAENSPAGDDAGAEILRFAQNDSGFAQNDSGFAENDRRSNENDTVWTADTHPGDEPPPTPLCILEAMLFVGHPQNTLLTAQQAASGMRGVEPADIHDLVGQLNRRYDRHGCPYHIVSEGAGYRLALRDEYRGLRDKFYGRIKAARLSQAAIECLSLVAYRQPLDREEIDIARGVTSAHVLAQLVRRRLLRIERTETVPRKTLYYTTQRFLSLLGLEKLEDLPQTTDLERPQAI
jgi:segregation and condensation protein B